MRPILFFLFLLIATPGLQAQVTVSGTVYDISKINYVENVRVVSTGGMFTVTDSMGRYSIKTFENDSLAFYYNNKPTQKFAVHLIPDPAHFDISLRLPIKGKYSVLKEVMVFSKSYKQDSLENRQTYADIYDYTKPTVRSTISPGGVPGADMNELINIFRFKRNKRLKAFQNGLKCRNRKNI